MEILDDLLAGFKQVIVVLALSLIWYGVHRLIYRQSFRHGSLRAYLGLKIDRRQLDKRFWAIFAGAVLFAVLITLFQYHWMPGFREILLSENSPYGRVLKTGFTGKALVRGLIYCLFTSAGSEEILFRGLIARRLFAALGFAKGNTVQALIFWLMHLLIFRLITGEWFSVTQTLTFVVSFGFGLVNGYTDFRKGNQSILPGWLLHAAINLTTFLTLATLI